MAARCTLLVAAGFSAVRAQAVLPSILDPPPADVTAYGTWATNLTQWRSATLTAMNYANASLVTNAYALPDLAWTQNVVVNLHAMLFDERLLSSTTPRRNFTITKLIQDATARIGSVDVVTLWHTRPGLGLDARSQFQLLRDMPGGTDALYYMSLEAAGLGVKLLLAFQPWDNGTTPEPLPANVTLSELLYNNSLSGAYYVDSGAPPVELLVHNTTGGVITYFAIAAGADLSMPGAQDTPSLLFVPLSDIDLSGAAVGTAFSTYRWLERRHVCQGTSMWQTARAVSIQAAFLNAGAVSVWENVWGFANPLTPRDAELLRRTGLLSRFLLPITRSTAAPTHRLHDQAAPVLPDNTPDLSWLPALPSDNVNITVSQFYAPCPGSLRRPEAASNCTVYLLANSGDGNVVTAVNVSLALLHANVSDATVLKWYDLYYGLPLNASSGGSVLIDSITVTVEAGSVQAVLATPDVMTPELQLFLTSMQNATKTPLASFSATWAPVQQTMTPNTPTAGAGTPPPGTVLVNGALGYVFQVNASLPQEFTYTPEAAALAAGPGLDVQFPWEPAPTPVHVVVFDVQPFYMDVMPVTNAAFLRFIQATGYNASATDSANFLLNWITLPDGSRTYNVSNGDGQRPVTWVSRLDADAFCRWSGKRLPSDYEWQYAAQATSTGVDYRLYPWGNVSCAVAPAACPPQDTSTNPRMPDPACMYPSGNSALGLCDMVGNVWQITDSFCDAYNCAVLLRGGSLYSPVDPGVPAGAVPASRYVPNVADVVHHVRLPIIDDSTIRSAYIGFRCVVDTPFST